MKIEIVVVVIVVGCFKSYPAPQAYGLCSLQTSVTGENKALKNPPAMQDVQVWS